jgi:hypothetical protein
MREMLFEFSQENAWLETLHFHGEPKQSKIRLSLAFAELPKQNIFQKIMRLTEIIADICLKCPEGLAWAGWPKH